MEDSIAVDLIVMLIATLIISTFVTVELAGECYVGAVCGPSMAASNLSTPFAATLSVRL